MKILLVLLISSIALTEASYDDEDFEIDPEDNDVDDDSYSEGIRDRNLADLAKQCMKDTHGNITGLMPSCMRLRLKVIYEDSFLDAFSGSHCSAVDYIENTLRFVRNRLCDDRLYVFFKLEKKIVYHPGVRFNANDMAPAGEIVANEYVGNNDADLFLWMVGDNSDNIGGRGWVGALCHNQPSQRMAIAERKPGWVTNTVLRMLHELGHNLGMNHAGHWEQYEECTGKNIMGSWYWLVGWTPCQRCELYARYQKTMTEGNGWCLETLPLDQCNDDTRLDCNSNPLRGDGYCHDHLNTEECDWDGGDCCNNNSVGWNNYCECCSCREEDYFACNGCVPGSGCSG